jgi:hypothetical protein
VTTSRHTRHVGRHDDVPLLYSTASKRHAQLESAERASLQRTPGRLLTRNGPVPRQVELLQVGLSVTPSRSLARWGPGEPESLPAGRGKNTGTRIWPAGGPSRARPYDGPGLVSARPGQGHGGPGSHCGRGSRRGRRRTPAAVTGQPPVRVGLRHGRQPASSR